MKLILSILTFLIVVPLSVLHAADAGKASKPSIVALQGADDARVSAMRAGNREKLSGIFSDELHYAHSSGEVDTKVSFIDKLTSGKTKYLGIDYEKRDFTFASPGIALMTGRVRIRAASGESTMDSVLSFLAVWRLEKGS